MLERNTRHTDQLGRPMPTIEVEQVRQRLQELEQRIQTIRALDEEVRRREGWFVKMVKWVFKLLFLAFIAALFLSLTSCSRPVCDYRHVYRGSHKPKPAVHIQRGKLPRGSMLGILR